jgi:hypothetical protein
MGRVALGWLGEPTTRYGRLWLNCATQPTKSQLKPHNSSSVR